MERHPMSSEHTTLETHTCGKTIHTEYEDAQCDWEGDVLVTAYIDENWSGATWTCPRCGEFHEIPSTVSHAPDNVTTREERTDR